MNERIRELQTQAFDLCKTHEGNLHVTDEVFEKFAQLLVQDCVNSLMTPEYAMTHPDELSEYNRGWVNGRLLAVETFQRTFWS
jgi:hypothetical protein